MKKILFLILISSSLFAQRTIEQKNVYKLSDSLSNKVNKIAGKGLSTNDFTNTLKSKLDDLPTNSSLQISLDNKYEVITSIASLQAYTAKSIAIYDGSVWIKKAGNKTSNGGGFAGTIIRVDASNYWERQYVDIFLEWFGGAGDNATDNTAAFNNAIQAAPIGATIRLKQGIYIVSDVITIDAKSIKIIGSGQWSNFINRYTLQNPITRIFFYNATNKTRVFDIKNGAIDIQISNLNIYANFKADILLDLDRVRYSQFSNLHLEGFNVAAIQLKPRGNGGGRNDNVMWNEFRNISIENTFISTAVGIILDGYDDTNFATVPQVDGNACHNYFYNIRIQHNNYAIKCLDSDNNAFYSVYCYKLNGVQTGDVLLSQNDYIVANGSVIAPDMGRARSNYFYHLQGVTVSDAGQVNYVFGYDQLNTQVDPILTNGSKVERGITDAIYGKVLTFTNSITFSKEISSDGWVLGKGSNSIATNLRVGANTNLGSGSLSGTYNIAIGVVNALNANTSGNFNIAMGASALRSNTLGSGSIGIGESALRFGTTGNYNTALGYLALTNQTTGSNNVALGSTAGQFIANGTTAATIENNSVIIGAEAKFNADNETNQIVIGYQSVGNGSNSTVIGNSSTTNVDIKGGLRVFGTSVSVGSPTNLASGSLSGTYNIAIGALNALNANTSGGGNVAIGASTVRSNTNGGNNVGIGNSALRAGTGINNNVAIGVESQYFNQGNSNSTVGYMSLRENTTGAGNVAIGAFAGQYIANGSTVASIQNQSVLLGYGTKFLADNQINQIVIGYNSVGNGSNTTVIGNTSTTQSQLFGSLVVSQSSQPSVSSSAALEIQSTTKGFLPPRMTATEASAISSLSEGLIVYVTNTNGTFTSKGWWGYNGATWEKLNN